MDPGTDSQHAVVVHPSYSSTQTEVRNAANKQSEASLSYVTRPQDRNPILKTKRGNSTEFPLWIFVVAGVCILVVV